MEPGLVEVQTTDRSDEPVPRQPPGRVASVSRRLVWAIPLALFVAASGFTLGVDQARLQVQWLPSASAGLRAAAARQFGLAYPRAIEGRGTSEADAESFVLINPRAALPALRGHAAVASVSTVDATSISPRLVVSRVSSSDWLFDWQPQSTVLWLIAGVLLIGSGLQRSGARIAIVVVCLLAFTAAALSLPLDQRIKMGDLGTYSTSGAQFEEYFSDSWVRFEAHLSSLTLRKLHDVLGGGDGAAVAAFSWLSRGATLWFVANLAVVVAAGGGCTPMVLRYLALTLAMPASLLYFGYRELGYLALTPAAFPLAIQGLRGIRGRLEAGSALCGLGAALHGFGVIAIAGVAGAALACRARLSSRLRFLVLAMAFATAAYLGWVFVYIVGFQLTIEPGHAAGIPWRPLLTSELWETRVNWAILSPRGALDIAAAAWMAGAPLMLAAATAWRSENARPVAACVLPSALLMCALWPVQGLAVDTDLVVGVFPGVYALAWLLAESRRGTVLGLLVLVSSHVVFWRVIFSDAFVTSQG